jgi:hypothetical protein
LLVGFSAFTVISTIEQAADGCGRGGLTMGGGACRWMSYS